MSMLGGNGGGSALSGRTMVGIRGLTTVTPATTKKLQKKRGPDGERRIDRVVREDERSGLFSYVEPEEDEAEREALSQPPGHSDALRHVDGLAFRVDPKGRAIPPVYGDVDQGNLGDAWLLSACAAVAHAQPAKLMRRVLRNEDATFSVRLGDEYLTITSDFPTEGYADPLPNGQRDTLWVALIEKAYARHEAGSYAFLEHGSAGRALELLTGAPARRVSLSELVSPAKVFAELQAGKKDNRAMVVRTREVNVESPLSAEHHYAVLDASERNGVKVVKLYNPWGTKNNSRPLASMVSELKLELILSECEALYISGS